MNYIFTFSFKFNGEEIYNVDVTGYIVSFDHKPIPIEISSELSYKEDQENGDKVIGAITGAYDLSSNTTMYCGDQNDSGELRVNPLDFPFYLAEMNLATKGFYLEEWPAPEDLNPSFRIYDFYNSTARWHYAQQHGVLNVPGTNITRPIYTWEYFTSKNVGYTQISKRQPLEYPNPELFLAFGVEPFFGVGLMNPWECVIRNPRCIPAVSEPPPSYVGSDEYEILPGENLPEGDNYYMGSMNWIAITGFIVNDTWGGVFYRFLHELDGMEEGGKTSASPPVRQDDRTPVPGGRDYTKLSFVFGGTIIYPLQWVAEHTSSLKMNQRDDGRGMSGGPGRIGYHGYNGGSSSRIPGGAW